MEEGGDRKRKPGPISLDWGKLLPTIDDGDEPHTLSVVKAAASETSTPCMEAVMGGREEESHIDPYLSKLPIGELNDKIARAKRMLHGPNALPDGGEKLRVKLKELEAECKRRRVHKDDDKCKKVTLIADGSTVIDNGLSTGASRSGHASQSTFASHFCRKLGNERDYDDSRASGKELPTLHGCDSKDIRATEQLPAQRTQKIDSSASREAPFRSPTNDPLGPKPKTCGTHTYNPSSRCSDGDFCFEKNGNATRIQPPRKCSRKNRSTVVVVDEETEVDATDCMDQVDQSSKENPIYYPSRSDPEAIEICYMDLDCLAPESYLTSTIMNFYIRYLQKPASPATGRGCDYHFFNTYFYEKLKQFLAKNDRVKSFAKFRRWWKGVHIFEKAYIFLPIHENQHWSLVIICMPDTENESRPLILHLDSLLMHGSKSIFSDVKRFLEEEWTFLKRREEQPELQLPEETRHRLSRKMDVKVIEVPQQRNEYDCGLFVLFFMERFIDEAPERLKKEDLNMFGREWFRPEEASSLRKKIRDMLIKEFKNANDGTTKSDE